MVRRGMNSGLEEKEVEDQSPIEEVALVVPITDDPSLPVFTFRVWILGFVSCVVIMFLNTFYTYRTQPLTISAILAQILALPLGKFMAATLPARTMYVPFIGWEYNLNPGPFNMKEHVLITIFANNAVSSGGGDAYSIGAINVMKAYYKQNLSFIVALIIVLTTQAYNEYGKIYLSPLFALSIGSGFARIAATITHVLLFNGHDILKRSRSAMNAGKLDIHGRLMKHYKDVPEWWFLVLLVGSLAFCILLSFVWEHEVQLPWWGMILACGLAWFLTLPIGIIQATTNQQPGYDIIAQFIFGYIMPGRPIANLLFKIYGRISSIHALSFLADLKLGYYMKIPPRCMYTAQLVATVVTGIVNLSVAWWMLESIENICDVDALPPSSPWTCPKYRVTFDASVIWGLVGPKRLFGQQGMYRNLVWFFLVGALLPLPVWILSKLFPQQKWIPLINIPVITYGFAGMPPATPANISSWILTGTIFNYFVFRFRKRWWQRYNYVLSASLDAGTAFMGVLLYFALGTGNKNLSWWGTELDHCPLASCPTASGIAVKGCPVF